MVGKGGGQSAGQLALHRLCRTSNFLPTTPLPCRRLHRGTAAADAPELHAVLTLSAALLTTSTTGSHAGGRIVAQRLQLPLDLGWAMSVHKCQGMTLSRVEVNLERAFEPGMAYVALSRAQSLEGLRILGARIAPQALRADPRVVAFYAGMRAQQLRGYSMSP